MPKTIQHDRIASGLRQILGLVGRIPLSLDELVVPVVVADELRDAAIGGLGGNAGKQSAVVAEHPHLQIFNPADSGKIVYVLEADVSHDNATVGQVEMGFHAAALATTISACVFFDLRNQGNTPILLQRESNAATIGSRRWFNLTEPNTTAMWKGTLKEPLGVLPPGQGFIVRTQDQNVNLLASFRFAMRDAFPGES